MERYTMHLRLLCAAVAASALVSFGCATTPPEDRISYSRPDPEDVAFATGTDRRPTAGTLYALANLLATQGKESQAKTTLLRLINDYPQFVPAYNSLAEHYTRQNQLDDAHEALQNGLRLAPNDQYLLNNMGMLWLLREDNDRALEYFQKASESAPNDARYRANIAVAHGLAGRYDESLMNYVQILPTAQAHYNLAVLAQAREDEERARMEFQEAYNLDPSLYQGGPRSGGYEP